MKKDMKFLDYNGLLWRYVSEANQYAHSEIAQSGKQDVGPIKHGFDVLIALCASSNENVEKIY